MGQTRPSQKQELNSEIISLYTDIGGMEKHFNDLQGAYRKLASLWLLATISGIGYFLFDLDISLSARLGLIALALLGGFVGTGLIWNLDILVYQKLLQACFVEGKSLEERYRLPQIRHRMEQSQIGRRASHRLMLFYAIPMSIQLTGAIAALIFMVASLRQWEFGIEAMIISIPIVFALSFFIIRKKSLE